MSVARWGAGAVALAIALGVGHEGDADSPKQRTTTINAFDSIGAWKAVPADGVTMQLASDSGFRGRSLRIDFDFHGGGGYAVIHRAVAIDLPANYELTFRIRGAAPPNTLELKLIDRSGDNVWWSNQPAFALDSTWREVVRKKRHITFAWGPVGGGEIRHVAAIELAITAGTGGRGTVWLDELELHRRDAERPYAGTPQLNASGADAGHGPALALDGDTTTAWRARGGNVTLDIDFGQRREFGGLVLDWEPGRHATSYEVLARRDSASWAPAISVRRGNGRRDYLYLPESDARFVRLVLHGAGANGYGLREMVVQPLAWSASVNDFFANVAREAPRGAYPRYLIGQQSYWTVVGVDRDTEESLVNTDGMIEISGGSGARPSIEPFLFVNGRLVGWASVDSTTQSLDGERWPLPSVVRHAGHLALEIGPVVAAGPPDSSALYVRYRVHNTGPSTARARLLLAIRPFQVNPSWQFLGAGGGATTVRAIARTGDTVRVNGEPAVVALTKPAGFGAAAFDEGDITDWLREGSLPAASTVADPFGHASAALSYDLIVAPRSARDVDVAVPLHLATMARLRVPASSSYDSALAHARHDWRATLDRVSITLPPSAARITNTLYANLADILINRDGAALQPGSRAYARSWIRDGSLEATALLKLGHADAARAFLLWYAPFQYANGKIPCCVDHRGADPVPEHDSNGEFLYLVAEYWRHTGDRATVEQLWPRVVRAVAYLDSLRATRRTPLYRTTDSARFYGLLPPSISHEGYSAKPMHSYWDDFFAWRGYADAAQLARTLGRGEVAQFVASRDEFRRDLLASIDASMRDHRIAFIPGAADLGDFDATSTTIALSPGGALGWLPRAAVDRTFDRYWEEFVARRDGTRPWDAYTPYELRTVGAMLRLGHKDRALAALDFFFTHQRPPAWRAWAEVVWHDPSAPKFIGDMPHTWVGSDYIRSVLDLLAYERDKDSSLVIGAGVPEAWVSEAPGVSVRRMSTHYGPLSFTMRRTGSEVRVVIAGDTRMPPGGVVVVSPLVTVPRSVSIAGVAAPLTASGSVVVRRLPADIVFRY